MYPREALIGGIRQTEREGVGRTELVRCIIFGEVFQEEAEPRVDVKEESYSPAGAVFVSVGDR